MSLDILSIVRLCISRQLLVGKVLCKDTQLKHCAVRLAQQANIAVLQCSDMATTRQSTVVV